MEASMVAFLLERHCFLCIANNSHEHFLGWTGTFGIQLNLKIQTCVIIIFAVFIFLLKAVKAFVLLQSVVGRFDRIIEDFLCSFD